MKLLPENSVAVISKYILHVGLPCYIVYYTPSSISRATLHMYWYYPLVGVGLIVVCDIFGYVSGRLLAKPEDLATFRLLVAVSNWVFMALAVCEPIFGETGVRVVLLFNVGLMFYVFSFGMTSFRSGVGFMEIAKSLFVNPQCVACLIGFVLAIFFPAVKGMEAMSSAELDELPLHLGLVTPIWETIYLIGRATLPLSILQIGLLLGGFEASPRDRGRDRLALLQTVILRLVAAPALAMAALVAMCRFGLGFSRDEFVVSVVIMAMPVATLCLTVTQFYNGNARLAAKTVLWTSAASLLTVPMMTKLAVWAYGLT